MRRIVSAISVTAVLLSSCGGGGGADTSATAGIEPCTLLTEDDLIAVLGVAYPAEESEPAGPFTGCSWGTGEVLVSIAASETAITAPGEDDCPSAGLGEVSYACPGRVKFLVDGIHVTVGTISPVTSDEDLKALAQRVLEKLQE